MSASSSSNIRELTPEEESQLGGSKRKAVEMERLLPFIEKVQSSGALSLQEAHLVKCAVDYVGLQDEDSKKKFMDHVKGNIKTTPEQMVSNIVIQTVVRGQAKGAFTLEEAAQLCELLGMIN